ncbi:MAG: DUF89 family protein [Candidatus Omnitrophica bacterium]|nr:DUF89 family protein [Candidatus Omnitrophota bacterium]
MKTYLECIPCFFRQALDGARKTGAAPKVQKKIMDEFARIIPHVSLRSTPPEIARLGYALLRKLSRNPDPYKEIKQKSNRLALAMHGKLRRKVSGSRNKLLTAVELAIAGNIIDFGVKNNLDVDTELRRILAKEERYARRKDLFHYREFKSALQAARTVLYLGDNAGEVVFDRVLIEEIKRRDPKKQIFFAVKEKPIINDVLREDARESGIDRYATIISNGSDAPGTILRFCSSAFKRIYRKADMVISKGQGNFESLSRARRPIFFLFMVKCPVVERETGAKRGDIVLLSNQKTHGRISIAHVSSKNTAKKV